MIVIADATPLNYLVLLGKIEVLERLYQHVIVPEAVAKELQSKMAPPAVRNWISSPPNWLEIKKSQTLVDNISEKLDPGEREALSLALEMRADLVIVDDREARNEALRRNLLVIGTLGVLKQAAEAGLLDLSDTIRNLQNTTFYVSPALLQSLLESGEGSAQG